MEHDRAAPHYGLHLATGKDFLVLYHKSAVLQRCCPVTWLPVVAYVPYIHGHKI